MQFEVIDERKDVGYKFKRIKAKNLYGLMDLNSQVILEPQFQFIEEFMGNQKVTVYEHNNLMGYLGGDGQPICEAMYSEVESPLRSDLSTSPKIQYFKVEKPIDFERSVTGNSPVKYINQFGNYLLSGDTFVLMGTSMVEGQAIVLASPFTSFTVISADKMYKDILNISFKMEEILDPICMLENFYLENKYTVVLNTAHHEYKVDFDGNILSKKRLSFFKKGVEYALFVGFRWFNSETKEMWEHLKKVKAYAGKVKSQGYHTPRFND